MKTFRHFFIFEFKRLLRWWNGAVMILFFILSMCLTFMGVKQYKAISKSKDDFKLVERLKVKQFENYQQYGMYGIRLYFIPSPLCVLFNNTNIFSELTAHIDVGEKLNIYNSFKGEKVFTQKPRKGLDFSNIILLFGSLMALFYGYDAFRRKEYLKFISSFYGHRRVYFYTWFSRMIWLSLYFIAVTFSSILLVIAMGIMLASIEIVHLLIFILVMLLVMSFFFVFGAIASSIDIRNFLILLIWFVFVYGLPEAIGIFVEIQSSKIPSNYRAELVKLKLLMDFEKKVRLKIAKKPFEKRSEILKKTSKEFLEDEMVRMNEIDTRIKNETKDHSKFLFKLSIFFPSSFYLSTNKEIGGRGYQNVIEFYKYVQQIKEEFLEFYTKKMYEKQNGRPKGQMIKNKSFIRKEKNIFNGRSQLPVYFFPGLLITILWIIGGSLLSYYSYKKSLFSIQKKEVEKLNKLEIEINKGESHAIISRDKTINQYLYNILSGKNEEIIGKVFLNGVDIVGEQERSDFVYICHPDKIPWAIKAWNFTSLLGKSVNFSKRDLKDLGGSKLNLKELARKKFKELKAGEKGRVLLEGALLKKSDLYVIDDFARGMPVDFEDEIIDRIEKLKQKGAAILYLTNDLFMAKKIGDFMTLLKKDSELMGIKL